MTQFSSSSPAAAGAAPNRFGTALLAIRCIQFAFAVIVLGLTAASIALVQPYVGDYVTDDFGDITGYIIIAGQWSYMVFVAAWSILILCYLLPAAAVQSIHTPIAAIVLDALTVLLWFSSFIALAVWINAFNTFFDGEDFFSDIRYLTAADVFGAFNFVLFVISLAFEAMSMSSTSRTTTNTATPMQQMPPSNNTGAVQHEGAIQAHA